MEIYCHPFNSWTDVAISLRPLQNVKERKRHKTKMHVPHHHRTTAQVLQPTETTRNSPSTSHCPSVSRHSEQRLRPRICTACRACVSMDQRTSTPSVAPSSSLLPLNRLSHLPYCSSKAKKGSHTDKHKYRASEKSSDSGKLISCSLRRDFHMQESTGKCNPNSCPRRPGSLDSKTQIFPQLPVRTQSDPFLPQSLCFSDAELRKWILHFGGDEQAAFMARGLQKLHLAYEEGKAEMGRQAKHKG